ncbi:MAG: PilZ domain-containing protein [Thermodesulfobacteriota bacterium]
MNLGFLLIICFLGILFLFLIFWVIHHFLKIKGQTPLSPSSSLEEIQSRGEERRREVRLKVNWSVTMETPEGVVEAELKNISLGGAFICCKKPLPVGEIFNLTLIVPENEPLKATAKVVWTNEHLSEEKVIHRGMGIQFLKMSDRHIELVKKVLNENVD